MIQKYKFCESHCAACCRLSVPVDCCVCRCEYSVYVQCVRVQCVCVCSVCMFVCSYLLHWCLRLIPFVNLSSYSSHLHYFSCSAVLAATTNLHFLSLSDIGALAKFIFQRQVFVKFVIKLVTKNNNILMS